MDNHLLTGASAEATELLIQGWTTHVNAADALDPELLAQQFGDRKPNTVEVRLLIVSNHDSYHLGQVVWMRRLLGAWPPPAGVDTW